jgi:hypothetical protein
MVDLGGDGKSVEISLDHVGDRNGRLRNVLRA